MAPKKEETLATAGSKENGLKAALNEIQKQFGKEAIISFTDNSARKELEYVSSGSLSLDLALGGKGYPKGRIVELFSEPSCGKALDIETPILTTTGFKKMGDLKVGDTIFDINGKQTKVVFKTPTMENHDVYKVSFTDGSVVYADAEHIWRVKDRNTVRREFSQKANWALKQEKEFQKQFEEQKQKLLSLKDGKNYSSKQIGEIVGLGQRQVLTYIKNNNIPQTTKNKYSVDLFIDALIDCKLKAHTAKAEAHKKENGFYNITTEEILRRGLKNWRGLSNFILPDPCEIQTNEKKLPIDPYVFGYWLGDGHSSGAQITGAIDDIKELQTYMNGLGYYTKISSEKNPLTTARLYFSAERSSKTNSSNTLLKKMNVLFNKHIPIEYMLASSQQRKELLAGLIDSDGYINNSNMGNVEISFSNKKLAENVQMLVRSLGIYCTMHDCGPGKYTKDGEEVFCKNAYELHFTLHENICKLSRRKERLTNLKGRNYYYRGIESIEKVPTRPVCCIQVDSDTHCYLCGKDLIPTHNTTICLHAVAEVQKQGGKAAYFDLENALDLSYAEKLGVNVNDLIFSQPDSGEQALEMANILMKNNAVDIVVFDSVAAMIPRAELEGNIGDSFIGTTARLLSQGLKKIAQSAAKSNCLVMFINQTRNKIGVMYGSPLTTSGGEALKFYATQRLHITRTTKPVEERGEAVGNETKVKVIKNKVAPPFRIAEFIIEYNKGISIDSEVFKLGMKLELIERAGSYYSYEPESFRCQGEAAFKEWLHNNPEIKGKIIAAIKEKIAGGEVEDIVEVEPGMEE